MMDMFRMVVMTLRRKIYFFICISLACLIFGIGFLSYKKPFIYSEASPNIAAEQQRWEKRIANVGATTAYEELVSASRLLSLTHQHIYAHAFGAALYEVDGVEGMTVCDDRMLYGCFHEFLSHVIVRNGLTILPELEKRCPVSIDVDAPISCIHGIGHGLVAYFGYSRSELNNALSMCDTLLRDPWRACLQGVFMEYNQRFFLAADGEDVRQVPKENVYDPCDQYTGIYAQRCVGLLPVWWRVALFPRQDESAFLHQGEMCRHLPPNLRVYRANCFRGIGFTAVTSSTVDIKNVEHLCSVAAQENPDDHTECMVYGKSVHLKQDAIPDAAAHLF